MSFPSPLPLLRQSFNHLFNALLPPLCMACDAQVTGHQTLCAACWGKIQFIAPPLCSCCGAPFETPVEDGNLCTECLTTPPLFASARAAMIYNDASKPIILGFKHSDRIHPAPALAQWMRRASDAFWHEDVLIIPVPLHRWRLFKRRYNQSALLAQQLGALTGNPVLVDALIRQRATPAQGRMNREQRAKNVHGAFLLNQRSVAALKGKIIILVDDVLTTGATVNECCQVLLDGGASAVKVVTLARVKSWA